jgi:hypothetical protein
MHADTLRLLGMLALVSLALPTTAESPAEPTPTILFLVARPDIPDGDSYVLPLRDPADIADARALVADGAGADVGSIVVARIAAGADGINRDHRAPGKPEWSWHVTGFVQFAEITAEICDGTPTLVEADIDAWLANTDSTICFWTYTVVQELGPLAAGASTWSTLKQRHE